MRHTLTTIQRMLDVPRKVDRIVQLLAAEDLPAFHPRVRFVALFIRLLPSMMCGWLRPSLYRLAGVHFGPRCRVLGPLLKTM